MDTGYVIVYGVNSPDTYVTVYEEGIYLDYNQAFQRLVELNSNVELDHTFFEPGYGYYYYPETDTVLANLDRKETTDEFLKEFHKHILTDIKAICQCLVQEYDEIPEGVYSIKEMKIHNPLAS